MTAPTRTAVPFFARKSVQETLSRVAVQTVIVALAVVLFIPFGWMLSTALKPLEECFQYPPTWIPRPALWENFFIAWTWLPFTRYLINTLYLAGVGIVGAVFSSALVAYGFARYRAPGRDLLFLVLLSTMMLPEQVTLIPSFLLFKYLRWLNTYKPLLVPAFTGVPFFIFLLRQFYMTLPIELDEAARIDGCGRLGILWRIILPLSKPALATVAIFVFFNRWNAFLLPLIYLKSSDKYPLAVGLSMLRGENTGGLIYWNYLMAASILVAIPPLLVFFFAQRQFVQGIALTGLKG